MKILHLCYLAISFWVLPVQAAFLNGGFETGNFKIWSSLGDASVTDTGFGIGPVTGTFQALLTNAATATDGYNYSGIDAVAVDQLEAFLHLPTASLGAFEGTGIGQSFTANAGDILSFSWDFLTDQANQVEFNDFAFAVLDGNLISLTNTASLLKTSNSPFLLETGYAGFSQILSAGNHSLSFAIVDVGDGLATSGLLIDNVSLSATPTTVPEPSDISLWAVGFLALVSISRLQKSY
ncbi:PEP-CTERM sorting domain-containing protein [Methylomonas albis]|uniref:PEP-CTERM sorting domain-containing protein n=1 Tax=Methylomonas albis TaxID=1854563 RepID=A0ABR9D3U7_9GAMM|nr:PEP-CTERM sorting domain-containing protein [Methylomonas albis]MBD9357792.1 PEP-CTERM sorting domain-containing protein [Methylomonas albis]